MSDVPPVAKCLFCEIAAGRIPARVVLDDEELLAFHDIDPKAPVHVLLIPRKHVDSVATLAPEDHDLAGRLVLAAGDVARKLGVADDGYRVVANTGADGGQSVGHLHFHLLAGRAMGWPPG